MKYKDASWYDDNVKVWIGDKAHHGPRYDYRWWWCDRFRRTWHQARIPKDANVVELGSGGGTFAAYAWHQGHRGNWVGIDFSSEGRRIATEGNRSRGHQQASWVGNDIMHEDIDQIFSDLDGVDHEWVFLTMECLEHLPEDRDLEVLRGLPLDMRVIITVPTFDANGHVRFFPKENDAIDRYGPLLKDPTWEWIKRPGRSQGKWHHLITGRTRRR